MWEAFGPSTMCSCWDCWPVTLAAFVFGAWAGLMLLAFVANR